MIWPCHKRASVVLLRNLKRSFVALGGAAAFLLAFPASPYAQDCGSAVRGSYNHETRVFSAGTSATDVDYSVDCTEGDEDSEITLPASLSLPNVTPDSYVVINVAGSGSVRNYQPGVWKYVVKTSDSFQTDNTLGHGLYFRNSGENGDVRVELRGAVTTRGLGATGMRVRVDGSGKATAVNMGTIATHGDTHTTSAAGTFILSAHGVFAWSGQGDAEAVNRGEIATGGDGARGIFANSNSGSAVATNRGTISVSGSPHVSGSEYRSPHGIFAWGRTAQATNFGTVETRGDRVRGVYARGRTATAANHGTIITRGNRSGVEGNFLSPMGVAAQSVGDATVVNSEGATVDTYGTNADALFAWSGTGNVNAVNAGTLRTHNTVSDPADRFALAAEGIYARSDSGSVTVVNEATGSVQTAGPRTWGIYARTSGDGADASATVAVTNRGSVATRGWNADGVVAWASHGGSEANPNAVRMTNARNGIVRTQGDMASGIIASLDVRDRGTSFGSVRAENAGSISTSGGPGDGTDPTQTASGVVAAFFSTSNDVIADAGDATAVNSGTVTVTGAGAAGLVARTYGDGAATAVNMGKIATHGDTHTHTTSAAGTFILPAYGVYAQGGQGDAEVVNRGEIATGGDGARGVFATSSGSAVATNYGTISTSGSPHVSGAFFWSPHGIFARGGAAQATNFGTVETRGDGGRGAYARGSAGNTATAANHGTIVTRGNHRVTEGDSASSAGVAARSGGGDATVVNSEGATVDTYGTNGDAMYARSDTGAVNAVNAGALRTHNTEYDPANGFAQIAQGIYARSERGSVMVVNEATGSVQTAGPRAFGIYATTASDGADASATVEIVNRGSVATEGWNADGVAAGAFHGGSEANPNVFRVTNHGTVETRGDLASGIAAAVDVRGRGTSFGSVRAENAGSISTSGGRGDGTERTHGVVAAFHSSSNDVIADAGDATAVNSGTVTVTGAGAVGLFARTYGDGAATVEMNGGAVTSSSADDPATTGVDEAGIGIWAATGAAGRASVTVGNAAVVRAPVAAWLEGGSTRLDLSSGWLVGDVRFGSGNDTLNITQSGVITGDVAFGDGEDELVFDIAAGIGSIAGSVTGLESMIKRGPGIARVRDAAFSASRLAVEDGKLSVRGHLDLGGAGTVTVENQGRLQVEVGDLGNDPEDHGRITAGGGVTFAEGTKRTILVAHAPEGSNAAQRDRTSQTVQAVGIKILSDGTAARDAQGQSIQTLTLTTERTSETGELVVNPVGTISGDGVARLDPGAELPIAQAAPSPDAKPEADAPEVAGPAAKRKSDRDRRFLIGGGGLFALLMFALDPFAPVEAATDGASLSPVVAMQPAHEDGRDGIGYWARAFSADTRVAGGTMRGVTLGIASRLGDGLHLGVSATPALAASADGSGDALDGARFGVQGRWESDILNVGASLSHGTYDARSKSANLEGLDNPEGAYGLRHDHAQMYLGTRVAAAGIDIDPSLSLFGGVLEQTAHTARSAALRAEVPALTRRYSGWKARLDLGPQDWLQAGLVRWRPRLGLATARVSTDAPDGIRVRQSDTAGALSFTTPAQAEALPRTMHALTLSASAQGETWKLDGGYVAAMAADDKPVHAVAARLRIGF